MKDTTSNKDFKLHLENRINTPQKERFSAGLEKQQHPILEPVRATVAGAGVSIRAYLKWEINLRQAFNRVEWRSSISWKGVKIDLIGRVDNDKKGGPRRYDFPFPFQ